MMYQKLLRTFGVSRTAYYKYKKRYLTYVSRRPKGYKKILLSKMPNKVKKI